MWALLPVFRFFCCVQKKLISTWPKAFVQTEMCSVNINSLIISNTWLKKISDNISLRDTNCLTGKWERLTLTCRADVNQPSMPLTIHLHNTLTTFFVDIVCIYYSIALFNSHTNDKVIGYNKTNIKFTQITVMSNDMKTVAESNGQINLGTFCVHCWKKIHLHEDGMFHISLQANSIWIL